MTTLGPLLTLLDNQQHIWNSETELPIQYLHRHARLADFFREPANLLSMPQHFSVFFHQYLFYANFKILKFVKGEPTVFLGQTIVHRADGSVGSVHTGEGGNHRARNHDRLGD